jgi:lysophospholipase L1-like esterase
LATPGFFESLTKEANMFGLRSRSQNPSPPRLRWRTRIALISFGVVAGLVLLEVTLRSIGFAYYFERRYKPGNHPDDAFVIMCVGDSATFGEGARNWREDSYPTQLNKMLKERHPDRKYEVVNMGFPGANSSQVARRIEGWFNLHHPDLVITLIGNNDVWNRNESYIYMFGHGERASFGKRLQARLRAWSDEIRVIRFARTVIVSIDDEREKGFSPKKSSGDDANPSDQEFERGTDVLGDITNIENLYRMTFNRISEVAEKRGIKQLWLDYHMEAFLSETDNVKPVLQTLGQPYLELRPYFFDEHAKKYHTEWICGDDWHPNEAGYSVMAKAVYNKLVELGHVPGPTVEIPVAPEKKP